MKSSPSFRRQKQFEGLERPEFLVAALFKQRFHAALTEREPGVQITERFEHKSSLVHAWMR